MSLLPQAIYTAAYCCDTKLQIVSAEVVKWVHEVGLENHVGDVNQSYLKRYPQTLASGHRPKWITLGSSAFSCSRTPDVLRRHFWQRCRMFWILPSYFQYLFLRASDKRRSPSTARGRGGGGTETDFLRHYSYVALNIGCHFTLCAVFNDQEYSDPPLG
jgi:hypothetical protein